MELPSPRRGSGGGNQEAKPRGATNQGAWTGIVEQLPYVVVPWLSGKEEEEKREHYIVLSTCRGCADGLPRRQDGRLSLTVDLLVSLALGEQPNERGTARHAPCLPCHAFSSRKDANIGGPESSFPVVSAGTLVRGGVLPCGVVGKIERPLPRSHPSLTCLAN